MALELLAGPYPILNRVNGQTVGTSLSGMPIWLDSQGLLLPITNEGIYLVQLDGAAYLVAEDRSLVYGLALTGSGGALNRGHGYAQTKTLITDPGEWAVDPLTLYRGARLNDQIITQSHNYARLHDRYLYPIGSRLDSRPLDFSQDWQRESSFTGFSNGNSLSWGAQPTQLVVGSETGQFVHYDWLSQRQVGTIGTIGTIGMSCRGLWYAARHGVYLSLHTSEGQLVLRLWAPTVQPAHVSAPSLLAPLQAGHRVPCQTRVVGAQQEPCPQEVVCWTLEGPGELLLNATTTDAEGWARTYYDAPLDAGGLAITLHVEVAC